MPARHLHAERADVGRRKQQQQRGEKANNHHHAEIRYSVHRYVQYKYTPRLVQPIGRSHLRWISNVFNTSLCRRLSARACR